MDVLAKELIGKINKMCIEYYFYKQTNVIEKAQAMHEKIQQYLSFFLQGNLFGMEDEEYDNICQYVLQVLKDYSEAFSNKDGVLMIDTLDYGLRELLKLAIEDDSEESHE